MFRTRSGAGYITQKIDIGQTLRQRADDHQQIAQQCKDPTVRSRLEAEARELDGDHRRFVERRFM